jgi:hypothetical protein
MNLLMLQIPNVVKRPACDGMLETFAKVSLYILIREAHVTLI